MYSLLEDSTSDLRSKKFKKLTKAICGLVSLLRCFVIVLFYFLMIWSGVPQCPVSDHHYGEHSPTLLPCKGEMVVRGCGLARQQFNVEAVIGNSQ